MAFNFFANMNPLSAAAPAYDKAKWQTKVAPSNSLDNNQRQASLNNALRNIQGAGFVGGTARLLGDYVNNITKPSASSRNQGTPYNREQYMKAVGQQDLRNIEDKYGNTAITQPEDVFNAAPSTKKSAQRFGTDQEKSMREASQQVASINPEVESAKKTYEKAMGNIKENTPAKEYGSKADLDVFNKYNAAGPAMSNAAFVLRSVDESGNPLNKKSEETEATSPEEAAAEAYGQDTTAAVIDPATGQAIPYSDLTLAGQQLAADDYAGHAAAQYLYGTEGLYDKYGDDWSKFQREGTYDEWQAALSDPRMAQYFTNITTDKDFLDDNGNFDFDKYWQHAVTLDAMNTPELSDRDFALVYGDSSGVLNANNMWRRDMMQNSPAMYGLSIDTNAEYPAEYQQYLNSLAQGENAPIYQDENGNMYYNGFGDNGLNNDQLLSLLNMQTMQDAMMTYGTPDAYSLNEANMLANMPGWNTTYSDEAAEGYSNNYGMPENFDLKTYNPYALNPNQLYYMLNGGDQVYDPTGYIMNEYMNTPAGLYYTRNS